MRMSIVTKGGDKGETGLYGGSRIAKNHPRIVAIGSADELNALLGIVLTEAGLPDDMRREIEPLQHLLFRLGADLATPLDSKSKTQRMLPEHVTLIEDRIAEIEPLLPQQRAFLLPGGTRLSALLHHARAVARRTERDVVTLAKTDPVNENVSVFLNRLSDYLFLLARKANLDTGHPETEVRY